MNRYANMYKILIYSKVFHVRSVTQGDVIRAEAKDIPRIFQVIFFRKCTINNFKKNFLNPVFDDKSFFFIFHSRKKPTN